MSVKILRKDNYLAVIENAAKGQNWMFRNLYAEIEGIKKDIVENGALGCGLMVSSILFLFKFIESVHSTVDGTESDMLKNGWTEITEPKRGAVIRWEQQNGHHHIGFYIGDEWAVSNDSQDSGFPHKHHFTYQGTRKIEKVYWHPDLD